MVRLVFLDLDGTVLNSRGAISPAVRSAVRRAHERGLLVSLATGRSLVNALPVARALGIRAPIIVHNGAKTADPASGRTLAARPLSPAAVSTLLTRLHKLSERYLYFTNQPGPAVDVEGMYYNGAWDMARLIPFLSTDQTYRLPDRMPGSPAGQVLRALAAVNLEYAPAVTADQDQYKIIPWGQDSRALLDVVAPGVSKGAAMRAVADNLHVPLQAVAAVGDQMNDLDMIRAAGLGVAMGNAISEVQAAAQRIIGSHDDGGVAAFLNDLSE
ncbi:MAG: Cof-type HAD-IIB family hydrolase [Thermaerobacterales bacterium]